MRRGEKCEPQMPEMRSESAAVEEGAHPRSGPCRLETDGHADIRRQELLNALPVAIYITDTSGLITFYNEAAAALWGRRPTLGHDKWCGSPRLLWSDGTPLPPDQSPVATALKEQRTIPGMEAAAERPDGSRVSFIAFPSLLRDHCGATVGVVNTLLDTSAYKHAGATIARQACLIEASDDAIISTDVDGVITSWNGGAERLFGYSAGEAIGNSMSILLPSEGEDDNRRRLDCVRRGLRAELYETVGRHKDGSQVEISLTISPLRDANGSVVGGAIIGRDISERKRVEGSAQRLASIIESSDDAIISKDLNGVIRTWNKAAEKIFGYLAEEIIGKPITILIPPEYLDEESAILERVRGGQRIDHYETVRQRKHGGLIDISLSIAPIRDARGTIVGASKIARDITERKRNEAYAATLAREVEHRAKNILAAVQATVHLTQSDTVEGLKQAIQGRIQALANVQGLLGQSRWTGAELRSLILKELSPYRQQDGTRAQIEGQNFMLDPTTAQPIAVTIHELATNAAKHGALSVPEGHLHIEWLPVADGHLILRWTESGGPQVRRPERQGFGIRVMEGVIRDQLKGSISFDWRANGLVCEITVPI